MLFASGGFKVKLYDIEQQQITDALENIRKEMKSLEQSGSLKGSLSAERQLSLISGCGNLAEAVEGAVHIQQIRWSRVSTLAVDVDCDTSVVCDRRQLSPSSAVTHKCLEASLASHLAH